MPLPSSSPYTNATMPTRQTGDPRRRPPQRDPPLPPLPPPNIDNVRKQLARPPPRKPVPGPSQLNDPSLVDASQVPSDLIPTAPVAPRPGPPPPKASRHGRSMSHPFPALFATKRKSPSKKPSPDDYDSDSDSDAEMMGLGPGSRTKPPVQSTSTSSRRPTGDKDYASGNCMTCGALSRWPKGLKVFKCTLCMTINDLVDLNTAIEANSHGSGARNAGRSSEDGVPGHKGESVYRQTLMTPRALKDCKQLQSRSRIQSNS